MSVDGSKVREALDLLRRDGWCKGKQEDERGRHCIVGAAHCVGAYQEDFIALDAVAEQQYLDRVGSGLLVPAAALNDHPDTTFEDIERVMEKAALRLDEAVQC